MRDVRNERIHRELFLATFGGNVAAVEPWVTDRLTGLLEEQACRAGETLYAAGDPPESYYFLRQGRVDLVGKGSAPWTYQGPSVFGMSDALLERPRLRTAVAVTDIQAMKVASEAWIELLEDSFPLARAAVLGTVRAVADLEARTWATAPPRPQSRPQRRPLGATLDVIERLAVLAEAPLLRGAGVQTLSDLASASEVTSFAPGEIVLGRGASSGRVLLLLEGNVEATRGSPDVRWLGGPGDLVCGVAAFADAVDAWEARAVTAGRALTFRVVDWFDLMEEHFDMVRATLGQLSLQREELAERLP
jgi:CRP-like cAMP-binding protein